MQLIAISRQPAGANTRPRLTSALCIMTAHLLCATGAMAQDAAPGTNNPPLRDVAAVTPAMTNAYDLPAQELGTTYLDSAVLVYKESGGRVQAIEPMMAMTHTTRNGDVLSARLTFDSLTGATPNGAAPWTATQSFVAPVAVRGSDDEGHGSTGASGITVINPITGLAERVYTTPAGTLPVDRAFRDQRFALDLGYGTAIAANTRINVGANVSSEQDYRSFSARLGLARELNGKATTLSLGVNFEHDQSRPFHGTPMPFSVMSGASNAIHGSKDVISVVAGVTQIMRPNWLVQLNYSYGSTKGYQTDPYKVVSLVNAVTGAPISYLYESRPNSRQRHAVYAASKLALGSYVTDVSLRYYHDDWGINSFTGQLSEHIPLGARAYVEPMVRYYHQSRADFFRYYLPNTAPLPSFASADSRLDAFSAVTFGATIGYQFTPQLEAYVNVQAYRQSAAGAGVAAPGALGSLRLFAGTQAISSMVGLKVKI